jgi:exopolyphosphatase/guanosine-5'-triphosphate,3'-diphosphate pyrophosphatase
VIDVGTNSVKFHVGELRDDGVWTTVVDRAEVTRLGEGIEETGTIASAADTRRPLAQNRRDREPGSIRPIAC